MSRPSRLSKKQQQLVIDHTEMVTVVARCFVQNRPSWQRSSLIPELEGEGYLAHLHDPLAAAVALDPGMIAARPAAVAVELTGTLTRGMTIADWSGRWGRRPNAQVGVNVDPERFFTRFIQRVGPFARRLAQS